METRRIVFTEPARLADGTIFEVGRVYELPAPSAQRWIVRNKAIDYAEPPPPEIEPKKPSIAKKASPKSSKQKKTVKPKAKE